MKNKKEISVIFYGIENQELARSNSYILDDVLFGYEVVDVQYVTNDSIVQSEKHYDVFVYYCRDVNIEHIPHFGKPSSFEQIKESILLYKPKIIIQLGDERSEENTIIHNSLADHCKLFLRQHRHESHIESYRENTIQMPVGYINDFLSNVKEVKKIKDRKISWSWVGQMTTNATVYKSERDKMIREFWKIWNNTTICDSYDTFTGNKLYDLYSDSIFVPCGRGNWSLECFRNFEATIAGAIPVVVGSENEIIQTFKFEEIPPWIYAPTWEDAVKTCISFLSRKDELQIIQDNNIAWWNRTMKNIRSKVDEALLDNSIVVKNYNNCFAEYVLENGGEVKTLTIPYSSTKANGIFNPSIFNDKGCLYLNLRSCNYTLFHSELGKTLIDESPLHYLGEENEKFITENYFSYIHSENLKPIFASKIITSDFDKEPLWHFSGLEDARLLKWDNKFYLCGTRRDTESTGIGRMELSEISVEHGYAKEVNRYRIPSPGDDSSYCEKNWMPIIDLPYHFVKWTNPTEIVKYDIASNSCHTVLLKDSNLSLSSNLRGGSQIIRWNDGYLGIVHEAYHTYPNNKFDNEYKQQFIFWDDEWNIIKFSPQFTVMGARIEFISGLTILDDSIIITFGYQDNASFIIKISQKSIEEYLNG